MERLFCEPPILTTKDPYSLMDFLSIASRSYRITLSLGKYYLSWSFRYEVAVVP